MNIFTLFHRSKSKRHDRVNELLKSPRSGLLDDKDFGLIEYYGDENGNEGIWQMNNEWNLSKYTNHLSFSSSSILGTIDGPYECSREFLLHKNCNQEIDRIYAIFQQCFPKGRFKDIYKSLNENDIWLHFIISDISTVRVQGNNIIEWKVTLTPKADKKFPWSWLHINLDHRNNVHRVSIDT